MKNIYALLICFIVVCSTSLLHAQLTTAASGNATVLANNIVGAGITVSNATINCPGGASGTFGNGNSTNIGLNTGVLMSSGLISDAIGPNNSGSVGTGFGAAGDADLSALSGFDTYDACVLEFDFEAVANQVSISYVFGSEEYLEWVGTQYNDVFGFLVSGPNPGGGSYTNENIAVIPVNVPVTINSINDVTNAAFFVDNAGGATIQYDGFTTVLTASLNIVPCATYHFKLAISDAGDGIYDSGVFLQEASFESSLDCNDFTLTLGSDGTGSIDAEDLVATDLSLCDFSFSVSKSDFVCSDEGENTVTVTADDGNGTVLTCEATVTVVVPEDILSIDVGATCRTVYFGYGPAACTTITANVSGGHTPYTYEWSTGETTQSITVCPSSTTDYYVTATDVNGCVEVSAAVHVIVVDVHCGNNNDKVLLCHIPPGNPGGATSVCVGTTAVPAHLAHGDFLGPCSEGANPCASGEGFQQNIAVQDFAKDLTEPVIWPNPGYDNIELMLPKELLGQKVSAQIRSLNGEVLVSEEIQKGHNSIQFSDLGRLNSGMYIIRLSADEGYSWSQKWLKL